MKSLVTLIILISAMSINAKTLIVSNHGDFGNQTKAITDYIVESYGHDFDQVASYTGTDGAAKKVNQLRIDGKEFVELKIKTNNKLGFVTNCSISLSYLKSSPFGESSTSITRSKVATIFKKSKRETTCQEHAMDELNNFLDQKMNN